MAFSEATTIERAWSVAVADDDESIRSAVGELLDDDDRFSVVASAASGAEIARHCSEREVDIAIVDVRMPTGGADAIAAIHAVSPHTKVIVFTAQRGRRMAASMLAAGALGLIHKGTATSLNESIAELLAV